MVGMNIFKLKQKPYIRTPSVDDEEPFLEKQSPYHIEQNRSSSSTDPSLDTAPALQTKRAAFFGFLAQCLERCYSWTFLLPICLTNICLVFIILYWHADNQNWINSMKHWCPDIPASPLITGIRYERRLLDPPNEHDPYFSDYGQDLTDAWFNLQKKGYFRASKQEMIQWGEYGEDSVSLAKGGYMAGFRVYHELHCLEWLKMEYNNPNVTAADPIYETKHLDHCIGVLLQGVMCRGDMATHSWHTIGKPPKFFVHPPKQEALCVDWNSVEEWIEPRKLEWNGQIEEPAIGPDGMVMSQEDVTANAFPH